MKSGPRKWVQSTGLLKIRSDKLIERDLSMLRKFKPIWLLIMVAFFCAACECQAASADSDSLSGKVSFSKDIQPLLSEKCVRCHGGVRKKAGLTFLSKSVSMGQLESGAFAIVPGNLEESELIKRIKSSDPDEKMPPEEDLTNEQISLLEEWISEGAEWEVHWSFFKPTESDPQSLEIMESSINPIDHYVIEKLSERGWTMSPEANVSTLVRRLFIDLTGLNPSELEYNEILNSWDENSYEELIDNLLSSPHFGERWARYWLDQARYADSDGYEKDRPRPNAWRYREWVIHAINGDMPFDEFTRLQLAGDIIYHQTPDEVRSKEMLVASAFHRQTLFNTEGGIDKEEDRVKRVVDRINTTSQIWAGITIECAQCHDHPYDPVSQKEFYQLFAFFNNDTEPKIKVPVSYNSSSQIKEELMEADVMGMLAHEKSRKTYIFHRGDFQQPKMESGAVHARTPQIFGEIEDSNKTLNRLDLANQLLSEHNPLTARVTVNNVWQKLFGRGLMPTLDDWGTRGVTPTHPKLLDWLALEFRNNGWSRKELIKTIMMSKTYRQSSRHRLELEKMDPNNDYLFRQNRIRLDAELIRDIFLQVAGLLDRKVGGPSVFPPLPPDVAAQSYANNFKWATSKNGNQYRRGLYTFFKRTAPHPNLILFDCTDSNSTISQRMVSNTPLQALATLQNQVFMDASRNFGKRLFERQTKDRLSLSEAINLGLIMTLSRPAHGDSETQSLEKLFQQSKIYYLKNKEMAAKLCDRLAGNSNTDTDTDHNVNLASWIVVSRAILNLDEVINRN